MKSRVLLIMSIVFSIFSSLMATALLGKMFADLPNPQWQMAMLVASCLFIFVFAWMVYRDIQQNRKVQSGQQLDENS